MRWLFPLTATIFKFVPLGVQALFESTFHSSSVVIQPFTILERSLLYDPDDTNLFLMCPNGLAVAEPGAAIYKSNGELVRANSTFGNCYDFNVQTYDGNQYLTLWVGAGSAAVGQQMGFGTVLMMNSNYEVVMNVSAVNPEGIDLHEFNIVKPENKTVLDTAFHTIPMDLSSIGGPMDGWYSNDVVQEIDIATGNVLFNWRTFDHVSLLESYNNISLTGEGFSEADPFDAVHINSIDKDKEGNYIISARHSQAMYKIAANGTILWRLDAKGRRIHSWNDTEFRFQHHARWRMDETHLSLYDDGAAVFVSTVEEMTVSLTKRFFPGPSTWLFFELRVRQRFTLRHSLDKNCSLAEGSIEPYGDTVVLGYGSLPWTEAYSFDTEELLFSAVIGPNNASLWNGGISNYRAFQTSTFKFTDHPTQPPNVSVTGGDIYVSWNGATHVASYTLFTGKSAQEVSKKVTRVPKSGFETKISAKGSQDFISVAAQAANGTTLGQSAVYRLSDGTIA
ncbi:ASST-domain-containing protein [Mycena galopus ATCC 62051]|nr:ASST-domain-containing protein [Mycena galopus ATCC 62051]